MATVAESLFGVTPESLQRQRQQQLRQEAMDFASISDPFQQANFAIYQGAGNLARGVGGLLGAQDPELMRVRQRQELLQGVDIADPMALRQAAATALQNGDPSAAQELARRALDIEKTQAGIAKDVAATGASTAAATASMASAAAGRLTTEQRNATALADIAVPNREDPKWAETYNAQLMRLTAKPEAGRKTSTVTAGGRKLLIDDLTGETIKDLGVAGKTLEESLGAGLGTLGKALLKGRESEAKEEGGFAAKDFNALGSSVAAGTASKRNIVVLENAMKNAFTGKFADVKEGVVTGLEGLGIKVGDDLRRAASNTQLINAMGTRYVFPLVKNFPGSLAAKELERLEKTAPNSLQQPETIETLMNLLKQDLAENEYTYNKAKQYKETNKGSTIGFNQADAKIEFQNKLTELRNKVQSVRRAGRMTTAERDQINALKKELGVD
jgi:hypothetical protein